MRKKRFTGKKTIKSQVKLRIWRDLPRDILLNIFNRLDPKEVFWVIALVCRPWQLVCWDVLFWKVDLLDLHGLANLCMTDDVDDDKFDKKMELALERVLRSIFDDHDIQRNSYGVTLPGIALSDKQLVSVAKRTPELQEILLIMADITGKGFSRAIREWRKLNVISLDSLSHPHYTHIIQEIGINCVQLIVLSISSIWVNNNGRFHLDEYNAQVIANSLHGLRGVSLADCYVYELGLQTIMSKCRRVIRVELMHCIRALEVGRRRRCRREFDAEPFSVIEEPLTAKIKLVRGEWSTDTLAGTHSITTVVNHLWK